MIPAVVLSSHVIGLGVIRSLGQMKVPVISVTYDKRDMGYKSKYITQRWFSPHPELDEKGFLDVLLKIGSESKNCLLIPADDATVTTVSKYKAELESYFMVAIPEWEITQKFLNKKYTYALAESIGVAVPRTFTPSSVQEVKQYGKSLMFPCLVKPCLSHQYVEQFQEKMTQVTNMEQLLSAYLRANEAGQEVMIQEIIPGDDQQGANYNAYFWNGQALTEFTAQKVRLAPPAYGIPRVVVSKHIPEIIEPGRAILSALGFYGYCCVEFKRDPRDGVYKLMEVNGRFNRSILLSNRCGINFPWLMYNHLIVGKNLAPVTPRSGVYWIDLTQDLNASVRYYSAEKYRPGQYLEPYLKSHIFAILDLKDPLPFLKRLVDLWKMACSSQIKLIQYFINLFKFKKQNELEKSVKVNV